MAGKSLNRVQLIGNLTRDPELRYTPSGAAVCTLGIATNRTWTTDAGEKREEVEYHKVVAWRKLAEICSQFLVKGRKVYVEGHLMTRKYTGADGIEKSSTEIVMDDMILIDSRRNEAGASSAPVPVSPKAQQSKPAESQIKEETNSAEAVSAKGSDEPREEPVSVDDIPF